MPNRRDPTTAARGAERTIHLLPAGAGGSPGAGPGGSRGTGPGGSPGAAGPGGSPGALDGLPWELPRVFLGLDGERATPEGAATWILPVPYEATTSWGSGTRMGPRAIIDASRYIELYDHELGRDPSLDGVYTFPALELARGDAARAMAELQDACNRVLDAAAGRRVIMIGGEHSVSAPAILAHANRSPERLTVLQFDAHLDLRRSLDGSPFSHACAMGRVIDRVDLVTVGARGISGEEWEAASARGNVTVINGEELAGGVGVPGHGVPAGRVEDLPGRAAGTPGRTEGIRGRAASAAPGEPWLDRAMSELGDPVYITFDVDFFDPSVMPATGTPEPGGGTWHQALALLRRVFAERRVVGADVVELAPVPGLAAPDFTAARLVYKLIGYWSG